MGMFDSEFETAFDRLLLEAYIAGIFDGPKVFDRHSAEQEFLAWRHKLSLGEV